MTGLADRNTRSHIITISLHSRPIRSSEYIFPISVTRVKTASGFHSGAVLYRYCSQGPTRRPSLNLIVPIALFVIVRVYFFFFFYVYNYQIISDDGLYFSVEINTFTIKKKLKKTTFVTSDILRDIRARDTKIDFFI